MYIGVILICSLSFPTTFASTVGQHSTAVATDFCYSDPDGCGPNTADWSPLCHDGTRQSPINMPFVSLTLGTTPLRYSAYRGKYFRMQNNGHSVVIDFDNQAPSNEILTFPDPLMIYGIHPSDQGQRQYKFASAHFHWGVSDYTTGSEHCLGGRCSAMELHLVHYSAKYASQADAVASGDENASTVIGVLIDVKVTQTVSGGILSILLGQNPNTAGTGVLKPIVDNLSKIAVADHDPTKFITVQAPLDLSKFLYEAGAHVFSYKGSLTTPGCNEQVNWFVLKRPASTGHQNIEAFRTILKDSRGVTLNKNHRPLQSRNGRKVLSSNVLPY